MSYIGKQPRKAALTSSDIEDGIITAAKIEDGAVVAAEIASNAVTTAKINADAVTGAKIADDVINSEHIVADSIDAEHYAAGSVDTTALGADAVTGAKIADDAINSEHYTDGSIDTAHIADGQVTTAKLATAVFTGATDIGADIADADLFLLDDGAGGTIRKSAASRIKTYIGSSDWVKLSSVEVSSNVASIEFISGTNGADFSSTYHQLVFAIDGLEMSGDNVRSRMVLGAGGAYRTDSNHYSEVGISLTGSGSVSHPNQTAGSMRLTSGGPDVGDSGSSQNGTVTCYNFTHGNSRAMVISQACVNNTDSGGVGNNNIQLSTHCFEYTNGAVDRAKFFPDSGTITDGKIIMYGLKA
jgi:hypothetical protein